ncbi:hypothetical protein RND81_03G112300 [Saponaria officinalis]|uniref:No apical meristem-associated C-terminal domain-containing protein n=1 Tax=Saponaria officinalis TaxID=3572 RepID=A0AAW1M683_SAPOF
MDFNSDNNTNNNNYNNNYGNNARRSNNYDNVPNDEQFYEWLEYKRVYEQSQNTRNSTRHSQVSDNYYTPSQMSPNYGSPIQSSRNMVRSPSFYGQYDNPSRQYMSQENANYPQMCTQLPFNNLVLQTPSRNTLNDEEDDVEDTEDVGDGVLGRQSSKSSSMGKNCFSIVEDEALISAFLRVSTDCTVGTNQKIDAMWVKAKKWYDQAREANPRGIRDRNSGMLGSRFRRISAPIMKWVACYEEAARRRTSGMSEDDVIKEAMLIHSPYGTFKFMHAWILLRTHNKWKELLSLYGGVPMKGVEQRASHSQVENDDTTTEGTNPNSNGSGKRLRVEDDVGEGASSGRPIGIKAAKRNKGKGKVKSMVGELAFFGEQIKNFQERKVVDAEIEFKKLNIAEKKLEIQEKKAKWNILQILLSKPILAPNEEILKDKLISELT